MPSTMQEIGDLLDKFEYADTRLERLILQNAILVKLNIFQKELLKDAQDTNKKLQSLLQS